MPGKEEKPAKPISITGVLSKLGEKTPQVFKDTSFQRWFMLVTLSLFIAFLLSPDLLQKNVRYKPGDVAEKDIKASRDFSVEYYPPPGENGVEAANPGPAQTEDLVGQTNPATSYTKTSEPRKQAQSIVKPVYLQIKKGEIIVREGERIRATHLIKLKAQQGASRQVDTISIFLGSALLTAIILKTLYNASLRRVKSFMASNKNLLFFCVLLALVLIAAKISLFVVQAVTVNMPHLSPDVLLYALPVTSAAMLVSVFFTADIAIIFSLPASILAALLLTNTLEFFIYFLVGSIIASRNVSQFKERGNVLKAGAVVGLVQVFMIIAFNLSTGSFFAFKTIESMFTAFAGGCLLGIIVIGLIPIVEIIFGYTTNFKLLELASMDHPLLQDLMVQAPGTYHHSVIVGSMAESAARAVGANSLLAKVSAYYHDIGKIKKPAYFIENQMGMDNKHERLAPSMSSLILISHVKDGVELAKKHKLGTELIDIIRQHHGTSLISYFYEKARSAQDPDQSAVRIEDFRYPGPIPQTKEAGLIMLADAAEAASRTLNDPTPARIQGMVQKIINNIFADGQLNDCELTLKDMHQIAKSFTRILTGIFHQRIEYPETTARGNGVKKTDADSDQQQTKDDKDRPPKDKEKSGEALKRLGAA
ncbi:MAG: HDIG domain-containing metalloprotein [Thermodesulfobacteriota bacterium]